MKKSPFVFSNLAMSLDGKIATYSRAHFPIGTPYDRKQMQVLRKKADIVIFGAETFRTYKKFCGLFKSPAHKQPANAVLSRNLKGVSPNFPFFKDPSKKRILFITEKISKSRLNVFLKSSRVVFLNSKKPLGPQILKSLQSLGYNHILIEGGGGLMWEFVSHNLIREYHVTLVPKIIGGSRAPTLVDGKGFDPKKILNLKLKQIRKVGQELYLTYQNY